MNRKIIRPILIGFWGAVLTCSCVMIAVYAGTLMGDLQADNSKWSWDKHLDVIFTLFFFPILTGILLTPKCVQAVDLIISWKRKKSGYC